MRNVARISWRDRISVYIYTTYEKWEIARDFGHHARSGGLREKLETARESVESELLANESCEFCESSEYYQYWSALSFTRLINSRR